jgi:hypothetical protein
MIIFDRQVSSLPCCTRLCTISVLQARAGTESSQWGPSSLCLKQCSSICMLVARHDTCGLCCYVLQATWWAGGKDSCNNSCNQLVGAACSWACLGQFEPWQGNTYIKYYLSGLQQSLEAFASAEGRWMMAIPPGIADMSHTRLHCRYR